MPAPATNNYLALSHRDFLRSGRPGGKVMEARRLVITGLVQGVGFRHHMVVAAKRLDITGWVRNRSDGSVEAAINGGGQQIAAMIHWATSGTPGARVAEVFVEQIEAPVLTGAFTQSETV
jgi:acylphosphatase